MKTLLAFFAAACLFLATGTSEDNQIAQILWSGFFLAGFYICCKIYETKFMSEEEKNERV